MKKRSNIAHQEPPNFMAIFVDIASKLEKLVQYNFVSFNPRPTLPSVAKDDWKQCQYLNIV